MKRIAFMGVVMSALLFGAASTSQAYPRPFVRPYIRAPLPVYGPRVVVAPRVYAPRVYYGYRPGLYAAPYYRAWGPGWYGPRVGFGIY
jgi:hypothetical protein